MRMQPRKKGLEQTRRRSTCSSQEPGPASAPRDGRRTFPCGRRESVRWSILSETSKQLFGRGRAVDVGAQRPRLANEIVCGHFVHVERNSAPSGERIGDLAGVPHRDRHPAMGVPHPEIKRRADAADRTAKHRAAERVRAPGRARARSCDGLSLPGPPASRLVHANPDATSTMAATPTTRRTGCLWRPRIPLWIVTRRRGLARRTPALDVRSALACETARRASAGACVERWLSGTRAAFRATMGPVALVASGSSHRLASATRAGLRAGGGGSVAARPAMKILACRRASRSQSAMCMSGWASIAPVRMMSLGVTPGRMV